MEITEVRIKLMDDPSERLQAFCSITFDDCFVIRDLKIIAGTSGPFVAMPSRKLTAHCSNCRCKNHLRAAYCNQCGAALKPDQLNKDQNGRIKLYADIAHPINSVCREMIQKRVIEEFDLEVDRSKEPGYISRYDDYYEDEMESIPAERPAVTIDAPHTQPAEPVIAEKSASSEKSPPETTVPEKTTYVESAEQEPRAPHRTPQQAPSSDQNQKPATPSSGEPKKSKGGFGSGIFE